MPIGFKVRQMTNGVSVEEYILSQPQESRQLLILAVSECLHRNYPLNSCELYSMARELRYSKQA